MNIISDANLDWLKSIEEDVSDYVKIFAKL